MIFIPGCLRELLLLLNLTLVSFILLLMGVTFLRLRAATLMLVPLPLSALIWAIVLLLSVVTSPRIKFGKKRLRSTILICLSGTRRGVSTVPILNSRTRRLTNGRKISVFGILILFKFRERTVQRTRRDGHWVFG